MLAVVLLCVVFKGAELSAPADPSEPYSAARPEWYFLFLFRFLKFQAIEHYGLAFGAIYVPTAILIIFVVMPIVGRWKAGHVFNIAFTLLLMVGIAGSDGTWRFTKIATTTTTRRPSPRPTVRRNGPSCWPPSGDDSRSPGR